MKKMTYIFLLLSFATYAQVRPELYQEEENFEKLTSEEIQAKKDVTLKQESIMTDTNPNTGIQDFEYYTGKDFHRLAGSYSVNPRITKLADFSAFEVSYAYKYWGVWWQGLVNRSAGTFDTVSENKVPGAGEGEFQRPKNSRETLFSYGFGLGYRFRMIYEWIKLENVFETISVYGMRHSLSESYRNTNYSGYGFRADYGVHMRANSSFFYGLKGSYNTGKVTRTLDEFESNSNASIALSWLSLGFEVGYYY